MGLIRIRRGLNRWNFKGSIGVFGAGKGVGTTHFTLMLANYFANVLKVKTAVIEYNGHNDFIKICDETSDRAEDIRHFLYKGVDFFHCDTSASVTNALFTEYQIYLFDLGQSREEYFEQFIKCDFRILVCGTELWQLADARAVLKRMNKISLEAVCFMPELRRIRELERKSGRAFIHLPIEANPFCIQSENVLWIEDFLKKMGNCGMHCS